MGGESEDVYHVSPLIAIPQVKAGKLRAIGITGLTRSPALPDVPPIADTLPGYENITWHSVIVPARTPKLIVAKLSRELMAIKMREVQERFSTQGLDAVGSTPQLLAALIKQETAMYAKLVRKSPTPEVPSTQLPNMQSLGTQEPRQLVRHLHVVQIGKHEVGVAASPTSGRCSTLALPPSC